MSPFTRGLAGFLEHIEGAPYYFSGTHETRVSNTANFPLQADVEFLLTDIGISCEGVMRYDSGRPWMQFEVVLPFTQTTLDFSAIHYGSARSKLRRESPTFIPRPQACISMAKFLDLRTFSTCQIDRSR